MRLNAATDYQIKILVKDFADPSVLVGNRDGGVVGEGMAIACRGDAAAMLNYYDE